MHDLRRSLGGLVGRTRRPRTLIDRATIDRSLTRGVPLSEALVTAASQLPPDPTEDRQAEQQPAAEHAIEQQSPDSSQHGFSVPLGTLPRLARDGRSGNNGVTGLALLAAVAASIAVSSLRTTDRARQIGGAGRDHWRVNFKARCKVATAIMPAPLKWGSADRSG